MALTRPPVLPVWADTGDKTQPSDLEIAADWPVTSIPPSRHRFNWFFNMTANAVRYFSRRGLSDWKNDESYEIGDRCISPIDQKTYKSKVGAGANIGFEPSVSLTQWERWGFTLSELWAYISGSTFGGTCPNTGPATAPTVAVPFTKYKSLLGEYWEWVGDAWKVVAGYRHDAALVVAEAVVAATPKIVKSFTCHRPGTLTFAAQANLTSTSSNQALDVYFSINGVGSARSSCFAPAAGWGIACAAPHTLRLALNDVITMSIYSNTAASINWGVGITYTD